MSFLPEISSYCIDIIKLTGSASREVLAHVVLLCARSDTHALLAPNYKEQQQIIISLKFSISLGVRGDKSQSTLPSIYFHIRGLQSSFLLILFRYSPISCSEKPLQNVAKNLKTVKTEKKTKQNKKNKNTYDFWNLDTIDPSNFEVNQIEGAKKFWTVRILTGVETYHP